MTTQTPEKQAKTLGRLLKDFFETEASGGIIMMFVTLLAVVFANIMGLKEVYNAFITAPIHFSAGSLELGLPLQKFVKDVFMVIFFMLVGLELKREMCEGFLSHKGQKLLPAIAACGGIAVPALIFTGFTFAYPDYRAGWAIPTATDIAFAVGVLTVIGRFMPPAAKIFLLAIAIYDDLAAIVIIALFYGSDFYPEYMVVVLSIVGLLYMLNRANIEYLTPYYICCAILAVFLYKSGLHSTIAGVITAMFIPMRLDGGKSRSPVGVAIHYLHPWVAYFILPLFAFVSAGISFDGMSWGNLLDPLPLAIGTALFIGKQIGVFGLTFLSIKLGVAGKPEGTDWRDIYAMSVLAGIGFTMSIFIGLLAFDDTFLQSEAKIGVILGSLLSAVWAVIVIGYIQKQREKTQ